MQVSIDAFGTLNNIMRSGSDFDQLVKNLEYYNNILNTRAPGTTKMMVHSAVGVYNINVLPLLEDFLKEKFPNLWFDTQVVQYPLYLSTRYMPVEYKQIVKQALGERYPNIVDYMMQDGENLFGHFINFHYKLNEIRNEQFADLNPLLTEFMNSYADVPSWDDSRNFIIKCMNEMKAM
jgi:hypothetical protein